jgi:hypothetical protein
MDRIGSSPLCFQHPNKSNIYYVKQTFLINLELQVSVKVNNYHQAAHKHVDVFYTY